MHEARTQADKVVVSIFVNPLQFGPGEDLDRYPRDAVGDQNKCRDLGVDVLFTPVREALYPDGFQTALRVGALASELCGASRPGHFNGVATIVLKLFNLVQPDVAIFGEKDYQQLCIIRRMVRDLDLSTRIHGMPIVRDSDGLAMSSRNAYLSLEERRQARSLGRCLAQARSHFDQGECDAERLRKRVEDGIAEESLAEIDYIRAVDSQSLRPVTQVPPHGIVLAVAVRFGATRLIDNCVLEPPAEGHGP